MNSKPNKALILIIILSLLAIFIVAISLLMAKNTRPQKSEQKVVVNDGLKNSEEKATGINVDEAAEGIAPAQEQKFTRETGVNIVGVAGRPKDADSQIGYLDEAKLAQDVLEISISSNGFSPSSFNTGKGVKVNASIYNADKVSHTFSFSDQALASYNTTIAPGETKSITIKTPGTPGTYTFFCSIPGHDKNNETGKMIIK